MSEKIGKISLDLDQSPIRSIHEQSPADDTAEALRTAIEEEKRLQGLELLRRPEVAQILDRYWYQRIFLPKVGIHTTSDHTKIQPHSPGPLHTIYGRLSDHEATTMRPLGKWAYLEKILPDMTGKTVLEIGSASGFFSFKFAEKGARRVNGVELWGLLVDNANWLSEELEQQDKVKFWNGDAFHDSMPRHDIVFLSETFGHSIVPFHALFRILGLATETVILDEPACWGVDHMASFGLQGYASTSAVSWTTNMLSEQMVLTVCHLAGVALSRVVRYRDDRAPNTNHTTFVIDVSDAERNRKNVLVSSVTLAAVEKAMGVHPVDTIRMS